MKTENSTIMKTITRKPFTFLFKVFLLGGLGSGSLQAQVNPEELIGYWRQDALVNKQISASEKAKRYVFTADSLSFSSPKINLKGPYTLDTSIKWADWHITIQGTSRSLPIYFKSIHRDTLYLWEGGKDPIVGVLVRIPEAAVAHYGQALEAQKEKNFELMFSEFAEAARYNHPDAMYQLGMCYFTGAGTVLDEKKGSQWIRSAADIGQREAQAVVGSLRY